jgi:LEA14-like dessication related protein
MKRKSILIILLLVVIIILPLAALGIYIAGIEEPDVDVKNIEYKSFDPDTQTLTLLVTIDIFNPNDITAELQYIYADVFIEDEFVGTVDEEVNEDIEGNTNTTIQLDFVVYDIPMITTEVVEVHIIGGARVKVFFARFTVPINEKQEVNIREEANQPPQAILIHNAGLAVRTGRDITFDGSTSFDADGEIMMYLWDFNDGSPMEYGATVRHAFQSRGTYVVQLFVFDNWNASGSDNAAIRVIGL